MARAARRRPGFGLPAFGSLVLHAAAVTALLVVRPAPAPIRAPVYKVDLVAAPPGPRAVGTVTPRPAAPAPEQPKAPPPPRPVESPKEMPAPPKAEVKKPPPRKVPAPATPTPRPEAPTKAPPERAGGGPTGGRGTDVVTVHTEGIEFPYPGYLSNIVRQIALNFHENPNVPVTAEVAFLIHRDGSVSNFRFLRRSGAYAFDLEAQGAVEAAGSSRAFGPLPDGFPDDVLPVVFSFDPKVLR